jgi:hypothetical protein
MASGTTTPVHALPGAERGGTLSTARACLAADGLGVAERTVWRWLDPVPARAGALRASGGSARGGELHSDLGGGGVVELL